MQNKTSLILLLSEDGLKSKEKYDSVTYVQ